MIVYTLKNSKGFGFHRRKIIFYSTVSIMGGVLLYLFALSFSSGVESRVSSVSSTTIVTEDPNSVGTNSLLTRAFIWHTAYNAFVANPTFGIGIYSFPFTSHLYYTIPKDFYELFVKDAAPHVGYIAVLTETGIVGFVGFIFLVVSIFRFSLLLVRDAINIYHKKTAIILLACIVYITFSLAMTDAWLWGQYIVLWGLILGMQVGLWKMIKKVHLK